jgi:serine/threonine-protein kinase
MRRGRFAVVSAIAGIAVFAVIGAYVTNDKAKSGPDIHSLAVLPFTNIGGDTANAYFADGMSDELTTELARIPGLTLASRSSVARLKGSDTKQIAATLNVGGVIDGTVRRAGNRLRLTAQLVDASSGNIVWTDSYEQQTEDVFAMQDSITKAIVAALRLKLSGQPEVAGVNPQGTKDLAAYDAYLQGRYLFARRSNLAQALRYFEQATDKDPKFARAYAGYAMAASLLSTYGRANPDSIIPLGIAAGEKAVSLDPNLADAHLGLANCLIFEFKWNEAVTHLKRAIELEPTNATAHEWYADVLYVMGRSLDALPEMRHAAQLDPTSPVINVDLGYNAFLAGHFDEAESALKKGMALD